MSDINRTMTINELVESFRSALLLLLPMLDKVGIGWREWERYDEWDRIEEALFNSIVCDAISHEHLAPAGIGHEYNPQKQSLLFDQDLGQDFTFSCLEHGDALFDTVRFDQIRDSGPFIDNHIVKPLVACRLAVLVRDHQTANDIGIRTSANIGKYPDRNGAFP